jgi:hypothetical protein
LKVAQAALKAAEDAAGNAGKFGHRGIVRVDANAHAGFLGYTPDEMVAASSTISACVTQKLTLLR